MLISSVIAEPNVCAKNNQLQLCVLLEYYFLISLYRLPLFRYLPLLENGRF